MKFFELAVEDYAKHRKRRKEVMERCDIKVTHGQVFVDGSYVASLNLIKNRYTRQSLVRAICYTAEAMTTREVEE